MKDNPLGKRIESDGKGVGADLHKSVRETFVSRDLNKM